jgi:hypothetical protein
MMKMMMRMMGLDMSHGWEGEAAQTPEVEEPDYEECGAYGFGLDGKDDEQVRPPLAKAGKVDLSAEDLTFIDDLVDSIKKAEKMLEYLDRAKEAAKHNLPSPPVEESDEEEAIEKVHTLLTQAGIADPEETSACARAAIARGNITFNGQADELNKVVVQSRCFACGSEAAPIKITLKDFLQQSNTGDWSVRGGAKCGGCEEQYFVTWACSGKPRMDTEKYLNHCTSCKGLGKCVGDRSSHCMIEGCDKHYFTGYSGSHGCPCLYDKYRVDCAKAGHRGAYLFFDAQEAMEALMKRAEGKETDEDEDEDDDEDGGDDEDDDDEEEGDEDDADEDGEDDPEDDEEPMAKGGSGSGKAETVSETASNPDHS